MDAYVDAYNVMKYISEKIAESLQALEHGLFDGLEVNDSIRLDVWLYMTNSNASWMRIM